MHLLFCPPPARRPSTTHLVTGPCRGRKEAAAPSHRHEHLSRFEKFLEISAQDTLGFPQTCSHEPVLEIDSLRLRVREPTTRRASGLSRGRWSRINEALNCDTKILCHGGEPETGLPDLRWNVEEECGDTQVRPKETFVSHQNPTWPV